MPMLVPDMACGSRCFGHCGDFLQGARSWPYAPFLVKLEELLGQAEDRSRLDELPDRAVDIRDFI